MIVVDQPLANLVALTLARGKYVTQIASDAKSASAELETWRPHLLIVDLDADDTNALGLMANES